MKTIFLVHCHTSKCKGYAIQNLCQVVGRIKGLLLKKKNTIGCKECKETWVAGILASLKLLKLIFLIKRIVEKPWTDSTNLCKTAWISVFLCFLCIMEVRKSMRKNHIVIRAKDICPKFCNRADSKFILPWWNGHHRTGNNKIFI